MNLDSSGGSGTNIDEPAKTSRLYGRFNCEGGEALFGALAFGGCFIYNSGSRFS